MASLDGVFFVEWPTWARLSFVLAGCLFVVLLVAYLVRLHILLRERKYEKQLALEQAERGEMVLANRTSDEIPFGIRALIEDAEIEGVWNSRAMTPLNQNEKVEVRSEPATAPIASKTTSRRNSSVSNTSSHDVADIGKAQASASLSSPKLQVRPLPNPPGTRRYIIGGRQKNSNSYARHTASEQLDPLERMKAVRSIHAAESGQLIPRWSSVY